MPAPETSVRVDSDRSAAPPKFGERPSQCVDRLLAGLAGGEDVGCRVSLEAVGPILGQPPSQASFELGGLGRVGGGVADELFVPLCNEFLARGDGPTEVLERVGGHEEVAVGVPAVELLGAADLVLAECRAVGLGTVVLGGGAVADMRSNRDQARPRVRLGGRDCGVDRGNVVAVFDSRRVPAIGVEPLQHVLVERHRRRPVELDVIVVVEVDQLAQTEVAGQRSRLGRDPFLEIAIRADGVDKVVENRVVGAVEFGGQVGLGDRHSDAVCKALAEGTGRNLDTRRHPALGMPRSARAPPTEVLELLDGQPIAGQVQQGVEEHAGMPGGQHEPIAVRPAGLRGRVAKVSRPQDVGHRCRAHRRAWVA